jgi:hypothetical protein
VIWRWVIAPICGMVVLIAWGMLFWGFLADLLGVFHKLSNDRAVTTELVSGGVPTGTYFMPWPRKSTEEIATFETQHKAGPFYRLSYVKPISFAQVGLIPQVNRTEENIYENIRFLLASAGRPVPPLGNVPNRYLQKRK